MQNAREIHISRGNRVSALLHEQTEYIAYLQKLLNTNPFIVVVVDGNNFLFNDAWAVFYGTLASFTCIHKDQDQGDEEEAVEG